MPGIRIWILHLLSLAAFAVWLAADPLFWPALQELSSGSLKASSGGVRCWGILLLLAIAVGSFLWLGWQFMWGGRLRLSRTVPPLGIGASEVSCCKERRPCTRLPKPGSSRSLRRLLAATTVVALWSALCVQHELVAWHGKRARFAFRIAELESIASPLRNDWPARDGDLPLIGPFMAYPFGRPSTLVLLQAPQLASQRIYVSAVERCDDGAIKLQLTGTDGGDWAEWHPQGSHPKSFVGGLADAHHLNVASSIGDGWYLVRYES